MLIIYWFLISILVAVLSLTTYRRYSRFFRLINKIPGPPGVPLLGNFFDFGETLENVFEGNRLRSVKYFPIYKESVLTFAAVTLLKPEDVEIVLSNPIHNKKSRVYDLFHPWLGTGLLTSDGEKWKLRRKLLTPAFHFSVLQEFIAAFNEATKNFIKSIEDQSCNKPEIEIVKEVTELTLEAIAETSMGTRLDFTKGVYEDYKNAVEGFSEIVVYRMVRPWWYDHSIFQFSPLIFRFRRLVKTLHDFTSKIIEKRKRNFLSGDLKMKKLAMLDLLIIAQKNSGIIDDDGIREEVDTFMFEGHDTTAAAICMILTVLANNEKEQEEVRNEIIEFLGDSLDNLPNYSQLQQLSYTERCIKECLRLYPSVPFIARDLKTDIETTTGYVIPRGAMVHLHIYDIHRNPEIFPDPEKFDPNRFLPENTKNRHPFAYIPFSAGPRNCIGQKFAMLEIKAVLCGVLRRFHLKPVDKLSDVVFKADMVLRSTKEIKLEFVKRDSQNKV